MGGGADKGETKRKHRGCLGKQTVSRRGKIGVAYPTTSRPHNTTDNYEREGANDLGAKGETVCDEPSPFHDERPEFIARGSGAKGERDHGKHTATTRTARKSYSQVGQTTLGGSKSPSTVSIPSPNPTRRSIHLGRFQLEFAAPRIGEETFA